MTQKGKASKSKGKQDDDKETIYVILWWHFQKPYVAFVSSEDEAKWIADTRNGVVMRIVGSDIKIDSVVDYYRRDDEGNPMPAEVRPYDSPRANPLVQA